MKHGTRNTEHGTTAAEGGTDEPPVLPDAAVVPCSPFRVRRSRSVVPAALAVGLLLTSCGFFSRSQSRFYTIERIAPAAPAAGTPGLPVGIDAIQLPPGFDRREIVVRKGDQQLDVRGANQWSANLETLVLHTLAFDLADRLPVGMVVLPGQVIPTGAMRGLDVVFEDLAAGPSNTLVLDARWVVRESGRAPVAHHDRLTVDLPSLESEAVAAGMSAALGALADRMAAALR